MGKRNAAINLQLGRRLPYRFAMLLKAAINGRRSQSEHPATPIDPSQQSQQAAIAVAAGAGAIHVHPRNAAGQESLFSGDLAGTLAAIRAACPNIPVGVSTGAWMVPDPDARLALIEGWDVLPDFASVNFHEPGALKVFRVLAEKGIGVEAGVWNGAAAEILRQSGVASECLRILIEPGQEPGSPKQRLEEIEAVLEGVRCSRLLHGFESNAWELIALASRRGYDTRIGLEDTLTLPDGKRARDNGDLVTAAAQITARPDNLLTAD
jgi:uncharacterized protein (DUF849 family)